MQYTANTPMHPSAGVINVSPDRGKKRTVFLSVITAGKTVYVAKKPHILKDSFGSTQAGIPIKDTDIRFSFQDWEGDMWICASSDGTLLDVTEPDAS